MSSVGKCFCRGVLILFVSIRAFEKINKDESLVYLKVRISVTILLAQFVDGIVSEGWRGARWRGSALLLNLLKEIAVLSFIISDC